MKIASAPAEGPTKKVIIGLGVTSVERSPSPLRNRYGLWTRNTSTNTGDMGHTPSSNIPWKSNHLQTPS